MIILPRQAWDKHRESSTKRVAFPQGGDDSRWLPRLPAVQLPRGPAGQQLQRRQVCAAHREVCGERRGRGVRWGVERLGAPAARWSVDKLRGERAVWARSGRVPLHNADVNRAGSASIRNVHRGRQLHPPRVNQ